MHLCSVHAEHVVPSCFSLLWITPLRHTFSYLSHTRSYFLIPVLGRWLPHGPACQGRVRAWLQTAWEQPLWPWTVSQGETALVFTFEHISCIQSCASITIVHVHSV